jgi:hypothetical protein
MTSETNTGQQTSLVSSAGLGHDASPGGGAGATYTLGFWYLNYRNLLGITYNESEDYNIDFFQKSRTRQKMKDYLRDISFLAGVRLGKGTFYTDISAGAGYFWEVEGLSPEDRKRLSGMALTGCISFWFPLNASGLGVALSHLRARETSRTLLVLKLAL